jgi:DNA-binding FadR family transcriptional regulator
MTTDAGDPARSQLGTRILRPRQQVEEVLRAAVMGGQLKTGERLPPESELARQFGVSRPTIREAISTLESDGLIRKIPGAGGGSFVQTVDHRSLGEVVQESMANLIRLGSVTFDEVAMVRQYLEVPSASLAAMYWTPEDLAQLQAIVQKQMEVSVEDAEVLALGAQFHTTIAGIAGNRVLASLLYALHGESEPVSYTALSPEARREAVMQHRMILEAIESRDAAAAESAITAHLTYLREQMKAAVAAPGNGSAPAADE